LERAEKNFWSSKLPWLKGASLNDSWYMKIRK
jgi:hypothetical protein